jgi:outer membrane protein assembly factor BamD
MNLLSTNQNSVSINWPRFISGYWLLAMLAVMIILLGGCSSNHKQLAIETVLPEAELYQKGMKRAADSNYRLAIADFEVLESRYPFGRYSEQVQLELTYAYYKSRQPDAAKAAAARFIRLHPQHEHVDYAYYLKGLTAFEENQSTLEKYLGTNKAAKDPGAARDSFADFSALIERFPDSVYAPDAQKRLVYLRNLLADHEIYVASYYMSRKAWLAAANRARYVVEHYQLTPAVQTALRIIVQAYTELGLTENAANAQSVLDTNFPIQESQSDSLDSKEASEPKSSFSRLILELFD